MSYSVHFSFFMFFQCFSPYFKSYSLCFSLSMNWSFSPYSRSCDMHLSFSTFSVFLAIFQVKQWFCLFFHVFQYSRHIPGHTVWISHFPPISVFLATFNFLQLVFLIFHEFQFSRHTPGPSVCISHISSFSGFLNIFQVLHCVFLIFHDFQFYLFIYFGHILGPVVFIPHFPHF